MSNIIFEINNQDWYSEYAFFNLDFFHGILLLGIKVIIKQKKSDYNGSISLNFNFYKENIGLLYKLLENNIKINIDVDYQIFNNYNLEYAINNKLINLITVLIELNINIDYTDIDGNTALHIACEEGDNNLVSNLLTKKCVVDKKNNLGNTPLIEACINNYYFIITQLIDFGADVNTITTNGWSPLMFVCCNYEDSTNIVEYLILKGANTNISSEDVPSIIELPRMLGNIKICEYLEKYNR
jgi:ankyrin repeat protein